MRLTLTQAIIMFVICVPILLATIVFPPKRSCYRDGLFGNKRFTDRTKATISTISTTDNIRSTHPPISEETLVPADTKNGVTATKTMVSTTKSQNCSNILCRVSKMFIKLDVMHKGKAKSTNIEENQQIIALDFLPDSSVGFAQFLQRDKGEH